MPQRKPIKKNPAIQFYCHDWLGSATVQMMSPLEECAYFRLLLFMWLDDECGIDDDIDRAVRLTRTDSTTVEQVFKMALVAHPESDGRLTNERLFELYCERREYQKRQSNNGKKSAEKRRKASERKKKEPKSTTVDSGCPSGSRLVDQKKQPKGNSPSPSPSPSPSNNHSTILAPKSDEYEPGADVVVPSSIDTPEVRSAVGRWIAHTQTTDKPIQSNSTQEQDIWRILAGWSVTPDEIVLRVAECTAGGWQNLRRPENAGQTATGDNFTL